MNYDQDAEHLRILSICYYVMSGLTLLFALFLAFNIVLGVKMASHAPVGDQAPVPPMAGWLVVAIGLLGMLFLIALAALEFTAARKLAARKSRVFCMVVAGVNCLNVPFGMALGIFTFIVLSRPAVAESFARGGGSQTPRDF